MSEMTGREFGEVYMTWADDPPNGPRLRIGAAAERVLITVPLLALIDAGESPWASLRDSGPPGEGDPYGYRCAVLRIQADNCAVAYRIREFIPGLRAYAAERDGSRGAEIATCA